MIEYPEEIPETIPNAESMLAILVVLLFQVPPVLMVFNVVVSPKQTLVVPVIVAGIGLVVTTIETEFPETV
jgi:hypothetical protein